MENLAWRGYDADGNVIKEWNPRYVAYARTNGNTPGEQLKEDNVKYPGGRMAGYINWCSHMWFRFREDTGEKPEWGSSWSDRQCKLFDSWLQEQI